MWLLLCFFFISLSPVFFPPLVYSVLFVNSHSVLLLITCYLSHHILVAQCFLPVYLPLSLSPISVYRYLFPPPTVFFSVVKDILDCLISQSIEAG